MEQLIGLIIFALIYGVMWFLNQVTQKGQEQQKQAAAERQRQQLAARQKQQQGDNGRTVVVAEPRKKYRQIEQFRQQNAGASESFITAETVAAESSKRNSVFDEAYDGTPGDDSTSRATDIAPMVESLSHQDNPIAANIMAMMSKPESMQQVVILSEIFNRPKYD